MASVLFEQQKYIEATHFIKKATSLNSVNSDYWLLQADVESRLGNMLAAIEAYNEAANLDPENIDIWLNWSLLYFEHEDYSKAFEIIFDAIEQVPDEADLHYRATVYLIFDGSYTEAYKYLQNGLELDFEAHEQIYGFFPSLKTQKALNRIIEQYR
jgi:tetratricopeptide (TPR) repeat protein